jgi:hypothetical protein
MRGPWAKPLARHTGGSLVTSAKGGTDAGVNQYSRRQLISYIDLENLARRHDPDLDLEAIIDHLAGVSVFPDDDFAGYGLGDATIADLRRWVTGWYDDLAHRRTR